MVSTDLITRSLLTFRVAAWVATAYLWLLILSDPFLVSAPRIVLTIFFFHRHTVIVYAVFLVVACVIFYEVRSLRKIVQRYDSSSGHNVQTFLRGGNPFLGLMRAPCTPTTITLTDDLPRPKEDQAEKSLPSPPQHLVWLLESTEWRPIKSTVVGVEALEMPPLASGGICPLRVKAELSAPATVVADACWNSDPTVVKVLSPDVKESRTLQEISLTRQVQYQRVHTPFPVANRDFVYERNRETDTQGIIVITQWSVTYPDAPPVAKVVRGSLDCITRIYPLSDTTCRVDFAVQCDPKGSIPTSIVNSYKGEPAQYLHRLKRYVTK